jgi:transcriptional regulator with XRE-family HTH domain
MDLKRRIAVSLKAVRKARRLTQADLAERTGRSVDAISNIEREKGLPSVETLEALAKALDIPIVEFFNRSPGTRRESSARLALLARLNALGRDFTDRELETAVRVLEALRPQG